MSHLCMPELIIHFHLSSVSAVEKPHNIPEKRTILEFSLFYYSRVDKSYFSTVFYPQVKNNGLF